MIDNNIAAIVEVLKGSEVEDTCSVLAWLVSSEEDERKMPEWIAAKVMPERKMTPMMDAAIFQRLLDVLPEALLAFNPCLSANSFHASSIFTFFGFPFFIAILTIAMS